MLPSYALPFLTRKEMKLHEVVDSRTPFGETSWTRQEV